MCRVFLLRVGACIAEIWLKELGFDECLQLT